jgi:hypothetical protein
MMEENKKYPVYPPLFFVRATERFRQFCMRQNRRFTHPNVVLWEMVHQMWVAAGISVAVQLGIADLLKHGPMDITALARETGTHEDSLYRLMRMLCTRGLFKEQRQRTFVSTRLSVPLQDDQIRYMLLSHLRPGQFQIFGDLMHSIKTGKNVRGIDTGSLLFEQIEKDEERNERFTRAMTSSSKMLAGALLSSFQFSKYKRIIDVGGGQGFLMAAILSQHPGIRGTVFDLPGPISKAARIIEEFSLGDRMDAVTGDFFKKVPEGGDLYLMKSILHDWNDEDALRILARVREAMPETSKLLVIEPVIGENNKPEFGKMTDILMLAAVGGKERTWSEWEELLTSAGFRIRKIHGTVSPQSLIEAVKSTG